MLPLSLHCADVRLGMQSQDLTLIEAFVAQRRKYLINGATARLKNFYQHFWELGLSAQVIWDRNYAKDVLLDRGGARRNLLEIAAAIEKYHHQKKPRFSSPKPKSPSKPLSRF